MKITYIIVALIGSLLAGCVIRNAKRDIEQEHRNNDLMTF